MKKILLLIVIFLLFSCKKNKECIYVNEIKKKDDILIMSIENNSGQDYFILNPNLDVYTNRGADMIKTTLFDNYLKSKVMDSLICKVFISDCELNDEYFSQVIKLPKKKVTTLKYKYFQNFDESKVEYYPIFPYNIDLRQKNSTKEKIHQLKKILDANISINDYKIYIDEIKYNRPR